MLRLKTASPLVAFRVDIGFLLRIFSTLSLISSLFTSVSLDTGAAAETVSKSINVKAANGSAYPNALVRAVFYKKSDGTSGSSNLATTDINGDAIITYSSDIDYGYIFIQPPASDNTHAIGVIQNIQALSSSTLVFNLKLSDVYFRIMNSDDSEATVGAEFSVGGTFFQTLRTGSFGMSKSNLVLNLKSSAIYLNPASGITNQLINVYHLSADKTDNGLIYRLYLDSGKVNEIAKVGGVFEVKFRPHGVKVTIRNSDGTSLTVPTNSFFTGGIQRLDGNDEEIWEQFGDSFDANVGADGVWYGGLKSLGKYRLNFHTTRTDSIPSFHYGNLWSNGAGLVSNTSADSGFPSPGQVLNLDVNLPATFLSLNFKDRDSGELAAFSVNISKKIGSTYSGNKGFITNVWSDNGKSAVYLPDGDYKLDVNAFVSDTFYVNVASGVYTMTNATGTPLVAADGKFILESALPNLKIKAVTGGTPLPGRQAIITSTTNNQEDYTGTDESGKIRRKIADGNYTLLLIPNGTELPIRGPSKYSIKLVAGAVTEFKDIATNTNVVAGSDGFYPISLSDPKVSGTVTFSGTTFPIDIGFRITPYKLGTVDNKQTLTVVQPSNTAVNNSGNFGTTLEAGTYRFGVSSDVLFTKFFTTDSECIVPSNLVATCSVSVPAENLSLTVKSQDSDLLTAGYYLEVTQLKELSDPIRTSANPDPETGVITGRLANGNYSLRISPNTSDTSIGAAKSFRLSVVNSVVTRMVDVATDTEIAAVSGVYPLYLQKTNFNGLLKNGGVAVANASIWNQNLDGKAENSWAGTNAQGKFNIYLAEGNNDVTVRPRGDESPAKSPQTYRVVVRNGAVTSVKDASGTEVVAVDGFYPMGFESPNVSGQITIASVAQEGVLYAQRLDSSGKYFQWTNQYATISPTNGYAIKLDPGKYTFTIYLSGNQNLVSAICEVPSTGNVTCDTAFPTANLKLDVSNVEGTKLTSGFYLSPELITSVGATAGSCCTYPNTAATYQELSLLNGTYKISVIPDGTIPISNMANVYTITVTAGVVTSVIEGRSLATVTPDANGVYGFKFVAPGLSGTVVAYDGTTPVPNSNVYVAFPNQVDGYGTDRNGQYAIGTMQDGVYEIWAAPAAQDISQFRSDIRTVTVLNGAVSNQVIIQLNKPNVTGTVTGPTGITSKNNWMNVRKLDSNGFYQYIDKMWGRSTNGVGKYSYYLPAGTYIFELNSDSSVQGVRTTSAPCVVVAGVEKVCDITLASANLKFKVTNSANVVLPGSSGWYWLTEKVTDVVARDGWMSIDGNGNGQVYLEDGTWYLRIDPPYNNSASSTANFRVTVSGGAITAVKDVAGNTLAATDGVYTFQLPSGNLIGDITVGGVKTTIWNSITIKAWNGNGFNDIMNRGFEGGSYGFRVEPGLYRVEARPNAGSDSLLSTTKSAICEVLETGTTTCNIALQNANLLGSVKTPSGDVFKEVWGYIYSINDKGENWEQSVNFYDGKFASYLENGTYRLRIEPHWDKRSQYPSQDYTIVIVGGAITSVTNRVTSAVVTATDGRYSFTLSAPSVTGFVFMPGTSTDKVSNIQIGIFDATGKERWEYSTSSDESGKFGLNLPDGTYDLVARPWGSGRIYTTSAKTRITVSAGAVAGGDITLRLRAPNIWGVIVKPDGTTPLAEVNINMYMNGEYAYAWTGPDGAFGAYFENEVPTTCGSCQIYINHYNNTDYSSKNYSFTALGNLGNLAIGGVNVRATVVYPEAGGATSPSKWGYVAIEELDGANYIWQPGANTNELGKVGLSLTPGKSYRITAYPGWARAGDFVPKTTLIDNFSLTNGAHTAFTVTFAAPNISFLVKDRSNQANSWGWYQVNKLNVGTSTYEYYINGYLNDQGRGSQLLAEDGTYQITFWPGKGAGIEKTITVTVATGVVSLSGTPLTSVTTFVLPTGNLSGRIISAANTPVAGATVAAVRVGDPTKIVSTIALSDGTFELGLDMTVEWDIKALDPISGKRATLNVPIVGGRASNATVSVSDITVVAAP